jgi:hypothetical protein
LRARFGSADNELTVQNSTLTLLNADGGAGENTFHDLGGNVIDELKLKTLPTRRVVSNDPALSFMIRRPCRRTTLCRRPSSSIACREVQMSDQLGGGQEPWWINPKRDVAVSVPRLRAVAY